GRGVAARRDATRPDRRAGPGRWLEPDSPGRYVAAPTARDRADADRAAGTCGGVGQCPGRAGPLGPAATTTADRHMGHRDTGRRPGPDAGPGLDARPAVDADPDAGPGLDAG